MWQAIFDALKAYVGARVILIFALIGIVSAVTWIVYVFFSEGTRFAGQKYYDLKLNLSVEAAKCVAQIATSNNPEIIRSSVIRFEELYYGELVLIEDKALEGAMVAFRKLIPKDDSAKLNSDLKTEDLVAKKIDRQALRGAALEVSRAAFNLLQPNWFDQLKSVFRTPSK